MNTWIARLALSGLTAAALLLPAAPTHAASKLLVDNDKAECPTAAFTTIQSAIDAAAPGDTVQVCSGTYAEDVLITKPKLTLRAYTVAGQPAPLIVGQGAEIVVKVDSANGVTVRDLHIDGSAASDGGITVLASKGVKVENTTVQNTPDDGIAFENSPKGIVRNNTVDGNEFGIFILDSDAAKVTGNTVSNCELDGIEVSGATKVELTKNTVTNCRSGIIAFRMTSSKLSGNVTNANRQDGLVLDSGSTKNTLRDGTSKGNGAVGIHIKDSASINNKIEDYRAQGNGGNDGEDATTGAKTAGTANTWDDNDGNTSSPAGLFDEPAS